MATRDRILSAALEIVAGKGYHTHLADVGRAPGRLKRLGDGVGEPRVTIPALTGLVRNRSGGAARG